MKEFFLSWKFKVIVCFFALLVGFLAYAAIYGGASSFPENILKKITYPFAKTANSLSYWVEGRIDMLVNASEYKKENEILRAQLSEMYSQVMDVDDLNKENDQLRKILEIEKDNSDFEWSPPGNIILRNAADVFKGFTIDKGSKHNISIGDPVITDIGLVGVISDVSSTFSEIATILSTEVKIGVKTVSGNVTGIIQNQLNYSVDQKCLMIHIEKGTDINVGDMVITSGGSKYPPGIVVGEIKEISTDINGLSLQAVIEPSVNVAAITECFVITNFDGQGGIIE